MKEEQLSLLAKQISDMFSQIYYHCHPKQYTIQLTHQAVRALQYVALNQASTVQSVAEYLGCAPNTASEILRRLSEKELLIRQRNREDERVVELKVTEKGYQALQEHTGLALDQLKEVLKSMPEEKQKLIKNGLELLLSYVRKGNHHDNR